MPEEATTTRSRGAITSSRTPDPVARPSFSETWASRSSSECSRSLHSSACSSGRTDDLALVRRADDDDVPHIYPVPVRIESGYGFTPWRRRRQSPWSTLEKSMSNPNILPPGTGESLWFLDTLMQVKL